MLESRFLAWHFARVLGSFKGMGLTKALGSIVSAVERNEDVFLWTSINSHRETVIKLEASPSGSLLSSCSAM